MRTKYNLWLLNEKVLKVIHVMAFTAMMQMIFVSPALSMPKYFKNSKKEISSETKIGSDKDSSLKKETPDTERYEKSSYKTIKSFNPTSTVLTFTPDINEGNIGKAQEKYFDNGKDNLFIINLPIDLNTDDHITLSYDLKGVLDQSCVSMSINDRFAVGGFLNKKSDKWTHQEQTISARWLNTGFNYIAFTGPSEDISYKIKNIQINVQKDFQGNISSNIHVQQKGTFLAKDGKIYISGFITDSAQDLRLKINNVDVELKDGDFEVLINEETIPENKNLILTAWDKNGLVGQETVKVNSIVEAESSVPFENFPTSVKKIMSDVSQPFTLEYEGAKLDIQPGAINEVNNFQISGLRKKDILPLDPGMINVTKGATAYRFKPDGIKFNEDIHLTIKYDTALLPNGYDEDNIRSFYYNTKLKRWEEAKVDSIDKIKKQVYVLTNHFTDYINGIIQVPESPQTNAFTPTMMNDIKASDPSSNITLINPPTATQTGDAKLFYPIKIPAGRKGMQPNIDLQYSSNGGDGWLGEGWNIPTSGISIDTRWGVPTFGNNNSDGVVPGQEMATETEIYLLDGEQLMYPPIELNGSKFDWMPNRHYGEGVIKTDIRQRLTESEANFTLRNHKSFTKIKRFGNSPSEYYWKVTKTDGSIDWYGGKTPSDVSQNLAVIRKPGNSNNDGSIVYWALFMSEDVFGNNIRYQYENLTYSDQNSNLDGGQYFYLKNIFYTGFQDGFGNYKISFVNSSTVRPDATISGKNGFKQVNPFLLWKIDVNYYYNNQPIRSYFFKYTNGRFDKQLLYAVEEYGETGGYFAHSFDYYDDIQEGFYSKWYSKWYTINTCPNSCFDCEFPVPQNPGIDLFKYRLRQSNVISGATCLCPGSRARVTDLTLNGTQIIPDPDNQYLTHYDNGLANLCNNIVNFPNIDIKNPDFETSIKNFIYTAFSPITPYNVTATNNSYAIYQTPTSVDHIIAYDASFISDVLTTCSSTIHAEFPLDFTDDFNPLQNTYTPGITTDVKILTSDGSHDFGNYNFLDPYYLTKFQNDFASYYVGTTAIISLTPNGNISISISESDLTFISITLSGGGLVLTYPFDPCNSGGKSPQKTNMSEDWRNSHPSREDIQYAIDRATVSGQDLNKPVPPVTMNYQILDQKGNSYLYKRTDSHITWFNSQNQVIEDQDLLNYLGNLAPRNIDSIYESMNRQEYDNEIKIRQTEIIAASNRLSKIHDQQSTTSKLRSENLLKTANRITDTVNEVLKSNLDTINTLVTKLENKITDSKLFNSVFTTSEEEEHSPIGDIIKKAEGGNGFIKEQPTKNNLIGSSAKKAENITSPFNRFSVYGHSFRSKLLSGTNADSDPCPPIENSELIIDLNTSVFNTTGSELGSIYDESYNAGAYIGVGIGENLLTKETTFGVQYNLGWNNSNAFVSMTDIDGDGLDDIVIHNNDKILYRKHKLVMTYDNNNNPSWTHVYDSEKEVVGITNYYLQKGSSSTWNFQITSIVGFAGIDFLKSKAESKIYFTDANGDGLIDIVKNGSVYFNHLEDGIPHFEGTSDKTENLIIRGSSNNVGIPSEFVSLDLNLPGNDVVKVWEAPADGQIRIKNNIVLTDPTKESEVSIEMHKKIIGQCYKTSFNAPFVMTDVLTHEVDVVYDLVDCIIPPKKNVLPYGPDSYKIVELNNHVPNPNNLYLSMYAANDCYNMTNPYAQHCTPYAIDNPDFPVNMNQFISYALNTYSPFYITTTNTSTGEICNFPSICNQDLAYINHNSCYSIFNTMVPLPTRLLWYCIANCWQQQEETHYSTDILTHNNRIPVGINVLINVITNSNTYTYGPYDLYDPNEILLFQNQLSIDFPNSTVTNNNGQIIIIIPASPDPVISIHLEGTGVSSTYNFLLCDTPWPLALNSGEVHDMIPAKEEIEWAAKIAIAKGSNLNLPIPEIDCSMLFNSGESQSEADTENHYLIKIKKDTVLYYINGKQVSEPERINIINSNFPFDKAQKYQEVQTKHHAMVMQMRKEQQQKAKAEVDSVYQSIASQTHHNSSPNTPSTCVYNPEAMCLLFGTILNANNSSVINTISNMGSNCSSEPLENLTVKKGDRIYFRVHQVQNGNPPVNWNPRVEYVDPQFNVNDQNNFPAFNTSYSDGFILSGDAGINLGMKECTVTISGDPVNVHNLTDDIKYEITKTEIDQNGNETTSPIWSQPFPAGTSGSFDLNTSPLTLNFPASTTKNIKLNFNVFSTSNVRWRQAEWRPKTIVERTEQLKDENGNPISPPITTTDESYPVPCYSIYKHFQCSNPYSNIDLSSFSGNNMSIVPRLDGHLPDYSGTIYFVVKSKNALVGKNILQVQNGTILGQVPIVISDVNSPIELGFYSNDLKLNQDMSPMEMLFNASDPLVIFNTSGNEVQIDNSHINFMHIYYPLFGHMYGNWGQFMYNPKAVRNGVPIVVLPGDFINENMLVYDETQANSIQTAVQNIPPFPNDLTNPQPFIEDFTAFQNNNMQWVNNAFFSTIPLREHIEQSPNSHENLDNINPPPPPNQYPYVEKWIGIHDATYATKTTSCAGDFSQTSSGSTTPDDETIQDVCQTGAYAISKYSVSESMNLSVPLLLLSGSALINGKNKILSDYVDMNGDRYPDLVTAEKIQSTNKVGGLQNHEVSRAGGLNGNFSESTNNGIGFSACGSFPCQTDNKGSLLNHLNASIGLSASLSTDYNSSDLMWIDINGDGIPDLLSKTSNNVYAHLNFGNNTYCPIYYDDFTFSEGDGKKLGGGLGISLFKGSIEAGIAASSNQSNLIYTIQDINGDGMPDLLRSTDDKLYVKINTGTDFDSETILMENFNLQRTDENAGFSANFGISFCIPIIIFGITFKLPSFNLNGQAGQYINNTTKTFADFDADGFVDIMEKQSDNTIRVAYSNIRRTNKLKTVHNPLGGSFTMDYQSKSPTYGDPNPQWVMSQLTIDDGYGNLKNGKDIYCKDFEYYDGKYDRRERESFGYGTVKTIEYLKNPDDSKGPAYRTTEENYFNNSYFLKGLLKSTSRYIGTDPTKTFSSTENIYEVRHLKNDNSMIDFSIQSDLNFDVGGTEGRHTAIALLKETYNKIYETGNNPIVSKTSFDYDTKGRVITFNNFGDENISGDEYTTTITYYYEPILEFSNIVNIPQDIVVTGPTGVLRSRSVSEVNNITGSIGKIVTDLDNVPTHAVTNLDYDGYGNLRKVTLPENNNGEKMYYNFTYDTQNNKYIVQIDDALGFTSYATYDPRFDLPTSIQDLGGSVTSYEYDGFGRVVKIIGPKEQRGGNDAYTIKSEYFPTYASLEGTSYSGCVSEEDFVPVAITTHYDIQYPSHGIETYTFVDGLARPIQIKKDIELNNNPDPQGNPYYFEAMSVSGRIFFDEFARNVQQYHPVWENKNCSKNLKFNSTLGDYSTSTEYDEMDRKTKLTDENGNFSTIAYSISSGQQKTRTVTDQNGSQSVITETYKDVAGNVVGTVNVGPNGDVITSFRYDPIGQLTSYTDDDGLTSSYTYDLAGRKTSFTHPDNGLTSYTYDKAGQLTTLQTAQLAQTNDVINYIYHFNQLKNINFPNNGPNANISNVKYDYGDNSSGYNAGRITKQEDATGVQYFTYDDMGNRISERRTVVAPSPTLPNRTFLTTYSYDSWNRLKSIIYPDNEEVTYTYNFGGNLRSITGDVSGTPYNYVERIDYDHYEQQAYIKYGNGTDNKYTYSPSLRRLSNYQVRSSGNEILGDDTYSYDKVGNITSFVNSALPSSVNGMGGSFTNSYSYDVLNRLKEASGSFTGDRQSQEKLGNDWAADYDLSSIAYSNTGRILTKHQHHHKNGPGAVSQNTYNNTYSYIPGTHQISRITDQDLLTPVEIFTYDHDGNVNQRQKGSSTVNLYWDESNRLRVVSGGGLMQHYLYDADGERILKASSVSSVVYVNGTLVNNNITMDNYTTYPNGYIVVDPRGLYSKHYYIGARRIASRMGDATANIFEGGSEESTKTLKVQQRNDFLNYLKKEGVTSIEFEKYSKPDLSDMTDGNGENIEPPRLAIYYYHPDHLGTNTIITDLTGNTYQYFVNLPYGETMAEQMGNGYFQSVWKFNGKELDPETGLYYYGARYYDPRTSVWLGVDPMAEKFSNLSPYNYVLNNPIRLIDPDGNQVGEPEDDPLMAARFVKTIAQDFIISAYNTVTWMASAAQPVFNPVRSVATKVQGADGYYHIDKSVVIESPLERLEGVLDPIGLAATFMGGEPALMAKSAPGTSFSQTVKEAKAIEQVAGSTKGASKGSLSATKAALVKAKKDIGLDPYETLPKSTGGKFGSPMRGDSKKGYRLDPAHPNAKSGSGEEYPHINAWDYSTKRKAGGKVSVRPIEY